MKKLKRKLKTLSLSRETIAVLTAASPAGTGPSLTLYPGSTMSACMSTATEGTSMEANEPWN